MPWTNDRVDLLRQLWTDGLSASQIAAQLGGITRNAVIGKVHRMGLGGRARPPAPAQTPPAAPRREPAKAAAQNEHPAGTRPAVMGSLALKIDSEPMRLSAPQPEITRPEPTVTEQPRMTILTLTEYSCKWPIGDPAAPDFYFCGRRAVTGMPYCGHHARIAYQPVQDRRLNHARGRTVREK